MHGHGKHRKGGILARGFWIWERSLTPPLFKFFRNIIPPFDDFFGEKHKQMYPISYIFFGNFFLKSA
jgi:hypothetical protein